MKNYLKKLRKRCEQKMAEIRTSMRASDSADEVRSLGETLDTLSAELTELDEKLAELEGEGEGEGGDSGEAGEGAASEASRSAQMNPMTTYGNLRTVASFQVGEQRSAEANDDPFATLEYRQAFHQLVTRHTPLPEQHRSAVAQALMQSRAADVVTLTSDTTAVIPTTLIQDIITKADTYGNVYGKTTKTNIQGGVEIPIMDLKPTATWIGESEVSKDQKLSATDKVVFAYHGLECRIAQSILVSVVTIDAFEKKFVELGTEAMVKAMEFAVINGDGAGKMLGIVKDSRIKNIVTLTPDDFNSWEGWKKKVIAKIPKAYRDGEFIMEQGTFDGYIDGMVDLNGQPIARVNYGIDGGETYRFGGKAVETVEPTLLPSYEEASTGDVVAIFGKLSDYTVNSNMQMQLVQWTDHDTNKNKTKLMLICDGKVVDPHGFMLIKKGAAPSGA